MPNSNLEFEIIKIKTSKTEMTLRCLFRFFLHNQVLEFGILENWNLKLIVPFLIDFF